jgi:hypothetical protein
MRFSSFLPVLHGDAPDEKNDNEEQVGQTVEPEPEEGDIKEKVEVEEEEPEDVGNLPTLAFLDFEHFWFRSTLLSGMNA